MSQLGATLAAASIAVGALALSGCKGCRSDRPYTPFGVTSSLPSAPPSAAPLPSASAAAPADPTFHAVDAPKNATRLRIGEREVEAPAGRVFARVIAYDATREGKADVFAFTVPAPDAPAESSPGELHYYPHTGEPRVLLGWPSFLPSGPSCQPSAELSITGSALAAELRASCSTALVARAPTRAVVLLSPGREPPLSFGVRAADPAPGETLTVELQFQDLDQDGRGDPLLLVAVNARPNEPAIPVELAWFERAAGKSRDVRRTTQRLVAELDTTLVRAQRKKSAASALARLDGVRRALSSACSESGTPRVFDWDGAPFGCELAPDVIDRLGAIDVTARLTEGDLAGAVGALSRDGWYFGAMRPARRLQLLADVEKKLPGINARTRALSVTPVNAPRPHYSPLAFDAAGGLLVSTPAGVVRIPPNAEAPEPPTGDASTAPPAWPLEIVHGQARLSGVVYSCDRSEVQLLLTGPTTTTLPVPLLAPRPGVCRGGTFADAQPLVPIAATSAGIELVIGGARVQTGTAVPVSPRGSARSENGRILAVPSPLGLLVTTPERLELWKIEGWAAAQGTDCVIDSSARRAACVRGGRVELYAR